MSLRANNRMPLYNKINNAANVGDENKCVGLRNSKKSGTEKNKQGNHLLPPAKNAFNFTTFGRTPLLPLGTTSTFGNVNNVFKPTASVKENGAFCASKKPTAVVELPECSSSRISFKVFHDDEENDENINDENQAAILIGAIEKPKSNEASAVCPRLPLATLNFNSQEIPMVVDVLNEKEKEESASPSKRKFRIQESDVFLVEEYAKDIYNYLRELEARFCPKPNYMSKQPDVTYGMRSILIDWLVEVSEEYRLQTETLYLAVSFIDRFLSCMSVLRGKLQLVGTASMLVAAKYEEIYPPEVEEFVFITDDTYTQAQVVRMEQVILKVLKFDLAVPTAFYFLQRFSYICEIEEDCYHLALYLCELTLLEADPYLQFLPSIIAGSALCLACHTLDKEPWSLEMTQFTGYTISDFRLCLQYVLRSFINAADYPQQSIREKYRSEKFSSVANITPPLTIPL